MSFSALLLLATNMLPILGILFWGWDGFVLLVLYWLETLVIGFWMMFQVAFAPLKRASPPLSAGRVSERSEKRRRRYGFFKAAFFTVHAGIFMGVHMLFLWSIFAGTWKERVHSPVDFVRELVIGQDLWVPLAILFCVRGVLTHAGLFMPGLASQLGVGISADDGEESIIRGFYARIVAMHITLLAGGWIFENVMSGGRGLVIVVALKILLDLVLDPLVRARSGKMKSGVA